MRKINELELAKELIRYPSITPKDAGAINFLSKRLRSLGFKCKILEFKDKKSKPIKNLYARLGTKQPNLCYAGHTDVVPPGNINDWTVNPFKPFSSNSSGFAFLYQVSYDSFALLQNDPVSLQLASKYSLQNNAKSSRYLSSTFNPSLKQASKYS